MIGAMAGQVQREGELADVAHDIADDIGHDVGLAEHPGRGGLVGRRIRGQALLTQTKGLCAERLVTQDHHGICQAVTPGQQVEHRVDEADVDFVRRDLVQHGQENPWFVQLPVAVDLPRAGVGHGGHRDLSDRAGATFPAGRNLASGMAPARSTGANSSGDMGTDIR